MIRVLTVPHSGTRWLQDQLTKNGVEFQDEHIRPDLEKTATTDPSLPTLITLRDPLLCVISHLNQGEDPRGKVLRWEMVADMVLANGVAAVFCLGDGVEDFFPGAGWGMGFLDDIDFTPAYTTPDVTGLKARYKEQREVPELAQYVADLWEHPRIGDLFRSFGYSLPWMASA